MDYESTLDQPARTRTLGACGPSPQPVANAAPVAQRTAPPASLVARTVGFGYAIASYAIFFATFLYAFGFVAGIGTPTSLDQPPASTTPSWPLALAMNLAVLLLFALQHSVMARPWFKARWTRVVPEPIERSTYVLFSSLALMVLFAAWQPLGGVVWNVEQPVARGVLYGVMGLGWLLVLVSTFLINHFDLFGLRQGWLFLRGKPYTHLPFKTPVLYRSVRHPLYVGWFIGFWATPTMTAAHLVFALVTSLYILAAIRWEERDLVEHHGERYVEYRRRVPMLVPRLASRAVRGGA